MSHGDPASDSRIEELEIQCARLERRLDQLDEVVYEQAGTIEGLQRLNRRLARKIERLEGAVSESGDADDLLGGELTEGHEFDLDGEPRH